MIRFISMLLALSLVSACSYVPSLDKVIPDRRTNYQKSEAMPDLEIPPDLTVEASNDAMTIPGEGASLSQYQRSRSSRTGAVAAAAGEETASADLMNEQWVAVSATSQDIWPQLTAYFKDKGYSLDLNDADLGVLETKWSEPRDENGSVRRNMYRIISEAGADPGVTVLYITCETQVATGTGKDAQWQEKKEDVEAEKLLAGELNVLLNGSSAGTASVSTGGLAPTAAAAARPMAELRDAGDNKTLLALPHEFTRALQNTHTALDRAGFAVTGSDDAKGLFYITYHDSSAAEKKSFLSKLAFWKKDNNEGVPYILSLTAAGDGSQLIVEDEKGQWVTGDEALKILTTLRNEYNRL